MQRIANILDRFEQQPSHSLSSDVIGCVLPRGSGVDNYVFFKAKFEGNSDFVLSLDDQDPEPIDSSSTDVSESDPKKDAHERRSESSSPTKRSSKNAVKLKTKQYRKSTPERREQCRLNQERYRKKQAEREKYLTILVRELRDEVPLLEIQYTRMRYSRDPTVWTVVAEYFHLFCHGTDESQSPKARRQAAFLRSSMASDVIIGDRVGVDVLLEQWSWYSTYFGNLQFQLKTATQSSQLVWASSVLEVTITDTTLAKGGDWFSPCRLCFEWDEVSKRVVRLETMVDFLASLLQLLGSLEDISYVLERASIGA